jgi:hypothetical protein
MIGKYRITTSEITITSATMDIAEVLKIADDLMFDSTSKYLDNLQRSIVQGVWKGKTY